MAQSDLPLARTGGDVPEVVQYLEASTPPHAQNPSVFLHSLLRGRYRLAIALAVLGLIIGAPVGYLVLRPQYKSVGVIRIYPILPKILYQTEQNGIMPMFESFLSAQAALVRSRRVTGEAMSRPEWRALQRGLSPDAVAKFEESLQVDNPKGSPLIQVSFADPDPKAAATAVKVVIESYERVYADSEAGAGAEALKVLERLRSDLTAQLKGIEDRIQSIATDFGSSSLQQVYELKLAELNRVESQLNAVEVQLAAAGGLVDPTTSPSTAPAVTGRVDPGALELTDGVLRDLLLQKRERQRQARLLELRFGTNHPAVRDAMETLALIDRDIKDRLAQLGRAETLLAATPAGSAGADTGPTSRAQLTATAIAIRRLYDGLKAETMQLGQKNIEIERRRGDAAELRERLAETKNRIEQLNVEKNVGGRISIISYGDVPIEPEKDRRIALATVGGLGLAALGVAITALLGFLDRGMHHIDEARTRLKRIDRLLGVVPELPKDLQDSEQASVAAHSVHRIRAMLQIRQRTTGHRSFAITSPSPGEGKTTLTISLGMALASSGCETLLVDCDVDGGGLSARIGRASRRLLGQVLLDRHLLGEAKLQEGIELAKLESIRLGEALRKLGLVDEATIESALEDQRQGSPGLGDVLRGTPVQEAIRPTGHPSLWVLPLGASPGLESGRLAPETLRELLAQLSSRYGAILLDCGPALGSIEAAIVSAGADGVVLVVTRGADRSTAENAVNLLISAGACIEGIVFNRAEPEDLATSVYGTSSSCHSRRSRDADDVVKTELPESV